MPILAEINPSTGIRAGVWKITETAAELLADVQLSSTEASLYTSFHHELRKRQWLAYRALLKHLLAPLPVTICYDRNGKPFLESGSHHVSVSHAGQYAAAVLCENRKVGIDIEILKDRVERVKERFLQEKELESIAGESRLEQLYVFWGGKEALYKLHGEPMVDFRNDIYIHPFDYFCNTNHYCKADLRLDGRDSEYSLFYQKFEDFMLVIAF